MSDHPPKIVVTIDPDLEDLIPGFLKGRETDLVTIQQALEKEDFERIRLLGHSLKGNGAGYGFDELSRIGRTIETAATTKDVEGIRQASACMADYLRQIEVVFA